MSNYAALTITKGVLERGLVKFSLTHQLLSRTVEVTKPGHDLQVENACAFLQSRPNGYTMQPFETIRSAIHIRILLPCNTWLVPIKWDGEGKVDQGEC